MPQSDRALRLIAESLRLNTRVFDSVVRYGGEEFVVVIPGTEMDEAGAAAERLRHAVEDIEFIATSGIRTFLTVSVGVACTSVDAAAPDVLLKAADTALYEAKRKGRNRVELARAAATT